MFFKDKKTIQTKQVKYKQSDILDDRLYEFKKKMQELAKDEASASILARKLSNLFKAHKF